MHIRCMGFFLTFRGVETGEHLAFFGKFLVLDCFCGGGVRSQAVS